MILVFLTVILSFFLESIASNFIAINSQLFIPLFTIVSLIVIYPYFKGNERNYFKVSATVGFCYDIVFTDTPLMNLLLFLLIGYMIYLMNKMINTNIINISLMVLVCVILYRISSYGILCLAGFLPFHWLNLGKSIYSSLLLNMIYGMAIYLITDYFAKRYHIYKID